MRGGLKNRHAFYMRVLSTISSSVLALQVCLLNDQWEQLWQKNVWQPEKSTYKQEIHLNSGCY